jgi:hypothetical protein
MRDIEGILHKLALLRNADPQFRVFGTDHHHYQLNPCLTESEARAFEQRYGVTLPEEYRAFLLRAGNGGAGPGYGLFPLPEAIISDEEGYLARPFPHTEWWNGMESPNWWDLPDAHELTTTDSHSVDGYFSVERVEGSLRLAHDGCYYKHLVVIGPERGHIWEDGRAGDGGILPEPYVKGPYRVEGRLLIPKHGTPQRLTEKGFSPPQATGFSPARLGACRL